MKEPLSKSTKKTTTTIVSLCEIIRKIESASRWHFSISTKQRRTCFQQRAQTKVAILGFRYGFIWIHLNSFPSEAGKPTAVLEILWAVCPQHTPVFHAQPRFNELCTLFLRGEVLDLPSESVPLEFLSFGLAQWRKKDVTVQLQWSKVLVWIIRC